MTTNPAMWRCEDGALPVFLGQKMEDYVGAWRNVDAAVQQRLWMLAAIAARLERAAGGRPETGQWPRETVIQKFCRDVPVHRQTFHRYSRTYEVFSETCNTGVTSYFQLLPFKHFEVAARFGNDAAEATRLIEEAYEKKWSANELERQLGARVAEASGPKPFYLKAAERQLSNFIRTCRTTWPLAARRKLPEMLRQLAKQIEAELPPDDADDLPEWVCESVAPDHSDPIGLRDVEAVS